MKSNQIFLRPLEKDDLVLRPKWFNDPEIYRTLLMPYPIGYQQTLAWYDRAVKDSTKVNLSICSNSNEKVIGMTGLLNIDRVSNHAQFYITIGEKDFWGKRIPDEVIPLVLDHAFFELNLNKVYLWTIPVNERARHVYERNGFIKEAEMREHIYCRREYQTLIQHSILKSEWLRRIEGENN